jgi:peroxiredoxin
VRRVLLLAIVVLVVGFLLTLARTPSSSRRPAPDFVLPDMNGQVVRLSQLKGKVVMLNLWATWCPPCRKEMPTMEMLYRKMKSADFVMLAASQDVDGKNTVLPYLTEGGLTFPVLLDVHGEVGKKYGVTGYPETFIIDRQGIIVYHHIGYNDWSQAPVETALRRLADQGVWEGWGDGKTVGEQAPLRNDER